MAYESDKFRSTFQSIVTQDKTLELAEDLAMLFAEHDVPTNCQFAAIEYFKNPHQKESVYLSLIKEPLNYWNLSTDSNGPNDKRTVIKRFRDRLKQAGKSELISDDDLAELIRILFINHTVIEFSAFLTKQEVTELISENWLDIKTMLDDTSMEQDWVYSQGLKDKVRQPKTALRLKAEDAILNLPAEGYNDKQIATYLSENGLPNYDTGHIRVIRSRLKNTEKKK